MKKGSKFTPEQLQRIRDVRKLRIGVPRSEETKKKIALSKLGKKRPPLTEEWKRKISESGKLSNAGKYERTPEIIEKQSNAQKGKKLSPETRDKVTRIIIAINKQRTGENHHNWKGGITSENSKIRSSREYARWRTTIFERDNYTCTECGAKNGNGKNIYLEADHIKPFAFYPELRFDIDNGRTLCKPCHKMTETYGKKTN